MTGKPPVKASLQGEILPKVESGPLLSRLRPIFFAPLQGQRPKGTTDILPPDSPMTHYESAAKPVDGEVVSDTPFNKTPYQKTMDEERQRVIEEIREHENTIDGGEYTMTKSQMRNLMGPPKGWPIDADFRRIDPNSLRLSGDTKTGKSAFPDKPAIDPDALIEAIKKAIDEGKGKEFDPSSFYPPLSGRVTCEKSDEADEPKVKILPPLKAILFDEFEKHDPRPLRHLQNLLHEADPYNFPFKLGENMEYCQPHDLRDGGTTIDGDYMEEKPAVPQKKIGSDFKPG